MTSLLRNDNPIKKFVDVFLEFFKFNIVRMERIETRRKIKKIKFDPGSIYVVTGMFTKIMQG